MPAVPAVPEVKGARLSAPAGLAIALTALFALVIGFDAYAVYADWNVRALADRALADPSAAVYADLDRGYGLMDRAGTHQRRIAILTGIVFVVWFHRTRTNAEAFAPGADRLRPGWAIGGWFVPLANFWLPYRIAVATWGSSTPLAADGGRAAGRLPLMPVNLWWGSFVLSKVVAWYGGRSYGGAESLEEVRDAATTVLVGDVVDIVAAVLAVLYVRRLTALQHARIGQGPRGVAETPVPMAERLPD